MMRYWLHTALALSAALASTAGAQDARLAAIPDADARAAVGAIILEADRLGLPRDPLVTKALEGVEKRAAGPRIEAAVRGMRDRLVTARVTLGPTASDEELRAGADALAAGVPADAMRRVRATTNRSSAVALGVLAQLVARGVPSERATFAVLTLIERHATQPQLLALQRSVQDDIAAGVPPGTALEMRRSALIATLPPVVPGPAASLSPTGKPSGKP